MRKSSTNNWRPTSIGMTAGGSTRYGGVIAVSGRLRSRGGHGSASVMPLYSVSRVPAAKTSRTRTDAASALVAPITVAFRNVRRFTGLIILLAACACSAPPAAVRTAAVDVAVNGAPRIDVTIQLPEGHSRDTTRYEHAAATTMKVIGAWLAPFPDAAVSVDADRTPWWTAPASMAEEYAVARPLSRRYWERLVDLRALPPPFVEGLIEYSARRAVSRVVDEQYFAVYRARAEGRYFGGFVPRDLRARVAMDSGGDRMLRTLGTLERWTGTPVF